MNELDILKIFYDEMRAKSVTRDAVFISIDEATVAALSAKKGIAIPLEEAHRLTDICIANEWLERTTIDPGYNYLSLTEAGLQIVLMSEYR